MGLSDTLKEIIHQYPMDKKGGFKGAKVGSLIKQTAVEEIKKIVGLDEYFIKGSIGAGQFASIPWIAIMNNQMTRSTKEGVYIVFLFSADEQSVYLTLNQGITYLDTKKYEREAVQKASKTIYNAIEEPKSKPVIIDLHLDTSLGQGYEKTTISGYKYDVNNMPTDDKIKEDMSNLISDYQQLIIFFEKNGKDMDRFYESILGHSYAEDKYLQFKVLFENFVKQTQINLSVSGSEGKETTLEKYYADDKKYQKKNRFDSVTIEKIDMHIHLFSSSHYGPKNGSGSGKVPYIDYQIKDKKWANIRTTFHDYKMISVRFVIWDENKKVDIDLKRSFDISKMGLFSTAAPNKYFKQFYDEYMMIKEEAKDMDKDNALVNELSKKLLESKNIILRGAPGTGKSYLAKEIAASMIGITKEELDTASQFEFVQFHPSYDYTDFVEGLRPVISEEGTMGFDLQPGIFKKFCQVASKHQEHRGMDNFYDSVDERLNDTSHKYIFVIDEINRGEISKIFGELFFSIDPGYRGKEGAVRTQFSAMSEDDCMFYVPDNVYIIGTMNDIDRSVDTFDFAMRRRFRFIEITANESTGMLDKLGNKKAKAVSRMNNLNKAISNVPELNDNYHIGAAYFLKLETLSYELLWNDYLEPLLSDYVRGMFDEDQLLETFKTAYNKTDETGS